MHHHVLHDHETTVGNVAPHQQSQLCILRQTVGRRTTENKPAGSDKFK